jgi:hypothetical protein
MAKSDPNLLTQAEYARSRKDRGLPGGSREAVRKAVDRGHISAFGADKLLDKSLADSQWERNTRARVSPGGAASDAGGSAQVDIGAVLAGAPVPPAAPAAEPNGYTAARARTELANAGRAELELARLQGEVRDVNDITRGGFDIARELRDAMDSSVNTLAAELAPLVSADACATILRRHNRAIQEMLAKGLREKLSLKVATE